MILEEKVACRFRKKVIENQKTSTQGVSVFLKKSDRKKTKNFDSAGDRTQNLWFRRPAPYPLGHGVLDECAQMVNLLD